MNKIPLLLTSGGLGLAFVVGLTLSLPLQSPALILFGVAGLTSAIFLFKGARVTKVTVLVVIAWLYFIVRCVLSPVFDLAIEDLYLIFAVGLLYMSLAVGSAYPAARITVALVVIGAVVLHLGSGLMQLLGGDGYSLVRKFVPELGSGEGHLSGMYGYAGSFANFVGVGAILAISLGVWGKYKIAIRLALLTLGVAASVFVVLSQSRGGMIGLGSGLAMMTILLWASVAHEAPPLRKKYRGILAMVAVISIVVITCGGVWVFKNRALSTEGIGVLFDSDVRLGYWSMAVEQWTEDVWIGAGSRSYSYESFKHWSPNLDTGEANPVFVHNEYLQVLADYGLVGLLLILSVIGCHYFIGLKRLRKIPKVLGEGGLMTGSNSLALCIAGLAGMTLILTHALLDFRTHLMPNLLLLGLCAVWVLPLSNDRDTKHTLGYRWQSMALALIILGAGIAASYIGMCQLRAGIPLMKNQLASEHGAWSPYVSDMPKAITSLEQAVETAPTFRRHLHLGSLFRVKGENEENEAIRKKDFRTAIRHFQTAADRHAYEAVSRLNLASLYTYFREYEKAEKNFSNVDQLASSRERWFRINLKWADMLRQKAGFEWTQNKKQDAVKSYEKALVVLAKSEVKDRATTDLYFMILIEYTGLLSQMENFTRADELFDRAEKNMPAYAINSLNKNIRREMGSYYLKKAKWQWYNRHPEKAYESLRLAERSLRIHRLVLKNKTDTVYERLQRETIDIIAFLKKAGIGGPSQTD